MVVDIRVTNRITRKNNADLCFFLSFRLVIGIRERRGLGTLGSQQVFVTNRKLSLYVSIRNAVRKTVHHLIDPCPWTDSGHVPETLDHFVTTVPAMESLAGWERK
jgi:hypothetical protein